MARLLKWRLKDLRESIELMTSADVKFDCVCFIEGKRGSGKSTLAYKLLAGLNIEHKFNPRRDIVYSREDTIKHFSTKINGAIFADEMINVAFKRDFYNTEQKDLLKAIDMYRDSRNVFIGCIPYFSDLDKKMRDVTKIRLSVVRRGLAIVQMQIKSLYTNDGWDIKNNQKIESKWSIRGTKNPRYGQLTTARGLLYYGDLSPVQRELYDSIKREKRGHVFQRYQDQHAAMTPDQAFIVKVATYVKSGRLTPKQFSMLCDVNGKDQVSVRNQVNKHLKEMGLKKTYRDLVLSKAQREKRDALGFKEYHPES